LIFSGPSLPALLLGSAAVAFFLANEPVAVLLGARGGRLKNQLESRARVRTGILLFAGGGLGALGAITMGAAIWPELAFPLIPGLLLIPLVLLGRQKSLLGEMVVVTSFATLPLPLAAASGRAFLEVALATGVWWISFALGTVEVHAIKARLKPSARRQWTRWASPFFSSLAVVGALGVALGGVFPPGWPPAVAWAATALLPVALAVSGLSFLKVHPRQLKKVGWALVGANALTFLLLAAGA